MEDGDLHRGVTRRCATEQNADEISCSEGLRFVQSSQTPTDSRATSSSDADGFDLSRGLNRSEDGAMEVRRTQFRRLEIGCCINHRISE